MPKVNPKNAERWINSYFDSPYTVHLGFGALGAVAMWIIGSLDMLFGMPPIWVIATTGAGVSGLTYGIDAALTTIVERFRD